MVFYKRESNKSLASLARKGEKSFKQTNLETQEETLQWTTPQIKRIIRKVMNNTGTILDSSKEMNKFIEINTLSKTESKRNRNLAIKT